MKFNETRIIIPIWGEVIPGNTGKSKHDQMHWDDTLSFEDMFMKFILR